MMIAIVKTCDGPMYYSNQRNAARYAAVRMLIDQLKNHCISVFDMEHQGEADEIITVIENAKDPYAKAKELGFIREERVNEN